MRPSSEDQPADRPSTADITAASQRIDGRAVRTPLLVSEPMSDRAGSTMLIKAEHRQRTGSFKIRGALNKTFALPEGQAAGGVITASSGNHGIGVATAAAARGIPCAVYLPREASAAKVAAIGRLGADIVTVDDTDTAAAEVAARAAARSQGVTYISPYNDPDIIAGQGTIGLEILEDLPGTGVSGADAVVVAVGGGGLISGIATWVTEFSPATAIVGASPRNDQAMAASVAAGAIIDPPASPTYSDGTAGAVEAGAITFPICRDLVSTWMTVTESEIAGAVADMIDDHHELVEGAAGVALAAAARYGADHPGSTVVVVTCGANVSSTALRRMLAQAAEREHDEPRPGGTSR